MNFVFSNLFFISVWILRYTQYDTEFVILSDSEMTNLQV